MTCCLPQSLSVAELNWAHWPLTSVEKYFWSKLHYNNIHSLSKLTLANNDWGFLNSHRNFTWNRAGWAGLLLHSECSKQFCEHQGQSSADHEFKCQSFQISFLLPSHYSQPSQEKVSAGRLRGGRGKTCADSLTPTEMMNRLYRPLSLSLLPSSPSPLHLKHSSTSLSPYTVGVNPSFR